MVEIRHVDGVAPVDSLGDCSHQPRLTGPAHAPQNNEVPSVARAQGGDERGQQPIRKDKISFIFTEGGAESRERERHHRYRRVQRRRRRDRHRRGRSLAEPFDPFLLGREAPGLWRPLNGGLHERPQGLWNGPIAGTS